MDDKKLMYTLSFDTFSSWILNSLVKRLVGSELLIQHNDITFAIFSLPDKWCCFFADLKLHKISKYAVTQFHWMKSSTLMILNLGLAWGFWTKLWYA
jgi:hypothetical protein